MSAAHKLMSEALAALKGDPARAAALCRALLEAEPGNGDAKLVLSEALRRQGDLAGARALAAEESLARPQWFGAHRQLGIITADLGEPVAAAAALAKAAELNPAHPTIWRELGDQFTLAGAIPAAEAAYERHAGVTPVDQRLLRASQALRGNDAATAEPLLTSFLAEFPSDVTALRFLSEAQARTGRTDEAEQSLRRCLALAPGFLYARHSLGQLLMGWGRLEEARDEARRLLLADPTNRGSQRLMAAILNNMGDHEAAAETYQSVLERDPSNAATWMSLGHVLKTMGRTEEGVVAYRKSIALRPTLGESYWSLANLKTVRFSERDVAEMRAQLDQGELSAADRVSMLYALGKALDDRGETQEAFARYSEGAALQRLEAPYGADALTRLVARSVEMFTPDFFGARAGWGVSAPDPIFVIGLPRAGSTLIEQILASHSAVEGTMELPDVQNLAAALGAGAQPGGLDALATQSVEAFKAMGESYLRTTRVRRRLGNAFFIDKRPDNFQQIGLIHLILPNAKIIDARRHPMACGWSCFKQLFALGNDFSYDLADIGRYYADYVRLMGHYDSVLQGRVHRVIHEELAVDPEPQIRALLDYCGLPFEAACLRPHETERAVRTASSEQVRRPISAKDLHNWRAYEPWLGPLRDALGPALDAYPNAPA